MPVFIERRLGRMRDWMIRHNSFDYYCSLRTLSGYVSWALILFGLSKLFELLGSNKVPYALQVAAGLVFVFGFIKSWIDLRNFFVFKPMKEGDIWWFIRDIESRFKEGQSVRLYHFQASKKLFEVYDGKFSEVRRREDFLDVVIETPETISKKLQMTTKTFSFLRDVWSVEEKKREIVALADNGDYWILAPEWNG